MTNPDTDETLARMDAARIGLHVTCPASRHAAMMAEAMIGGEPYALMTEERKYCGSSIGETVASLWAARAENRRLRAALQKAEAALSDIGDADREPGDDLAWCEKRAAEPLPMVRAALAQKATG